MTVHELRQFFMGLSRDRVRAPLVVNLVSFGFKHGVPVDADLMFDVRCLPNPHFVPTLRPRTGRDRSVASFILRDPSSRAFIDKSSRPRNSARFAVTIAGGFGSSPSSAKFVTDFPEPDSPTIPSVSPARSTKETPSTARTTPRCVSKRTDRSSTSSTMSLERLSAACTFTLCSAISDRAHPAGRHRGR
jgi:hypothetical protein